MLAFAAGTQAYRPGVENIMDVLQGDLAEELEYQESLTAKVATHPCYSSAAHSQFGRIHVPVARKCNIQCGYCVRKYDCANENRPGVTTQVVSPLEAMQTVQQALDYEPRLKVLGIAGPGDPLANDATLETLHLAKAQFPSLVLCLSTNGLALPDKVDEMAKAGVVGLTITINAIDPEIGGKIYPYIRYKGKTYQGREGFEILSRNQLEGLERAARYGMVIKVNSVLIPGVNDEHLVEVARTVKSLGAYVMNIMPLIPQANFKDVKAPTLKDLTRVRNQCETHLKQFRDCNQCRADAIGVPGEGDISLPSLCSAKFMPRVRQKEGGLQA
jgi:nitrogen fixation protein NifB